MARICCFLAFFITFVGVICIFINKQVDIYSLAKFQLYIEDSKHDERTENIDF